MTIQRKQITTFTLTLFELIRAAAEDGECLQFEGNPTDILIDGKPKSLTTEITFTIEEETGEQETETE